LRGAGIAFSERRILAGWMLEEFAQHNIEAVSLSTIKTYCSKVKCFYALTRFYKLSSSWQQKEYNNLLSRFDKEMAMVGTTPQQARVISLKQFEDRIRNTKGRTIGRAVLGLGLRQISIARIGAGDVEFRSVGAQGLKSADGVQGCLELIVHRVQREKKGNLGTSIAALNTRCRESGESEQQCSNRMKVTMYEFFAEPEETKLAILNEIIAKLNSNVGPDSKQFSRHSWRVSAACAAREVWDSTPESLRCSLDELAARASARFGWKVRRTRSSTGKLIQLSPEREAQGFRNLFDRYSRSWEDFKRIKLASEFGVSNISLKV